MAVPGLLGNPSSLSHRATVFRLSIFFSAWVWLFLEVIQGFSFSWGTHSSKDLNGSAFGVFPFAGPGGPLSSALFLFLLSFFQFSPWSTYDFVSWKKKASLGRRSLSWAAWLDEQVVGRISVSSFPLSE